MNRSPHEWAAKAAAEYDADDAISGPTVLASYEVSDIERAEHELRAKSPEAADYFLKAREVVKPKTSADRERERIEANADPATMAVAKALAEQRRNGSAPYGPPSVELPTPSQPLEVARRLIAAQYTTDGGLLTLRRWRGGWWRWCRSHWAEVEEADLRADVYLFTEHASYIDSNRERRLWAPNRHKVADVLDALAALTFLAETVQQPSWIADAGAPEGVIVACANGLLHVATRTLLPHHPLYLNQTAVPFDFDADGTEPTEWLAFLDELWRDDAASVAALQEWFGYVISGRLDLHKIMLMVGPTRGGKGVISRILGALIGPANVAGPTLSSLGGDFGLAPLLGRPLAVISDARLSGRGTNAVVERLLAISGEDTITVNRKYREQWTGKLPSRFLVISNELPALGDAAGAIVGRFVVLLLTRSWLGTEDAELELRLRGELPGILNWALDGLARLDAHGHFTKPPASDEAVIMLADLASPVAAFVRDRVTRDLAGEVAAEDVFTAWKAWADDNGHKPGSAQRFGRDLRAVIPHLRVFQPKLADGGRPRWYRGITLDH